MTPRPNRDDFSEKTIRALALRANYRCSFPGCDIATSGPSEESPGAVVKIGVAAHIHAASPGGRRYLAEMTPEQRSDITNGIWLCANHSTEIDRDETRYTADLLRRMKSEHESRMSAELSGTAIPGANSDFLVIGPDLVCTGELIGIDGIEWRLRIDHFLIGNLSTLIKFSERFDRIDPYDRYVLVNALGDGRQLAAAPAWQKIDAGYVVSCRVHGSFPRISAHKLPTDYALNDAHDLSIVNGRWATVSGLAALPQKIKTCLSTLRGESLFNPTFGTRIKEYFDLFQASPWLSRLIKLEVIRMACVPYNDSILKRAYTPLQSVLHVWGIEQLPSEQTGDWLPFRFYLEVEGVGPWQHDISLFVPNGETPKSKWPPGIMQSDVRRAPPSTAAKAFRLLQVIYEQTKGKEEPIFVEDIRNKAGLSDEDAKAAWRYFRDKGLIDTFKIQYTARINARGTDTIESAQSHPDEPAKHFSSVTYNYITIQSMIGSSIQQGGADAVMVQKKEI